MMHLPPSTPESMATLLGSFLQNPLTLSPDTSNERCGARAGAGEGEQQQGDEQELSPAVRPTLRPQGAPEHPCPAAVLLQVAGADATCGEPTGEVREPSHSQPGNCVSGEATECT